jgi:hypothetical protein
LSSFRFRIWSDFGVDAAACSVLRFFAPAGYDCDRFWSSFSPYFGTCWCKIGVACHSVELDLDAEFVPAFFFGVTRAQSCRVFGSAFGVILVWKQHFPSFSVLFLYWT